MTAKRLLVTGGSGFIGSAFIRSVLKKCEKIVNLDLLTYASDPLRLKSVENNSHYRYVQGDICDQALIYDLCLSEQIDTIVHFAAESHVDRSIVDPKHFLTTNVVGTFALLEVVRKLSHIHFHHVSTDEVYGSLDKEGFFDEHSPYAPNSPYAASKAASDHFVRAYAKTYGLMTTISHSCNNYGPFQHPEKFIPLIISHCLQKKAVPIYGKGDQIRDWLYVDDHVEAIWMILEKATKGAVYNIGAQTEMANIDLVHLIMRQLSTLTGEEYTSLISYVPDRPGHDYRYAVNATKIKNELGWKPRQELQAALLKTILWTLDRSYNKEVSK